MDENSVFVFSRDSSGHGSDATVGDISAVEKWRPLQQTLGLDVVNVDRIEIRVDENFKQIHELGSEWRSDLLVTAYYKGHPVNNARCSSIEEALHHGWCEIKEGVAKRAHAHAEGTDQYYTHYDDINNFNPIEFSNTRCMQPGCPSQCVVVYHVKKIYYAMRRMEYIDPVMRGDANCKYYRAFCLKHRVRGDRSREDNDKNYEVHWEAPRQQLLI